MRCFGLRFSLREVSLPGSNVVRLFHGAMIHATVDEFSGAAAVADRMKGRLHQLLDHRLKHHLGSRVTSYSRPR